jgi:hypothetical protein
VIASEDNSSFEEETMSREENAERSETRSSTDETKKFSEDACGLGPRQAGPICNRPSRFDCRRGRRGGAGIHGDQARIARAGRHWATEIIDLGFTYFLYGCTGSSEWRTRVYADRRLSTIAKAIGEEEVRNAFTQAEQACLLKKSLS